MPGNREPMTNRYQSSAESFLDLLRENTEVEIYRLLWIGSVRNAKVLGLDVNDEDDLRNACISLMSYTDSDYLLQRIQENVDDVLSYGAGQMDLSPVIVTRRFIKHRMKKGILIGWIMRDLSRVEQLFRKVDKLEQSRTVWTGRLCFTMSEKTSTLAAAPRSEK